MKNRSKITGKLIPIGTFEVDKFGTLIISDPCYDFSTWCNGKISFAKEGTWHAYIDCMNTEILGIRNANLTVIHEDYVSNDEHKPWKIIQAFIGVDSGQCGIFNAKHFRNDELARKYPSDNRFIIRDEPGSEFYNQCCMITSNFDYEVSRGLAAGVVPGGAVSMSGFGDGRYDAYYFESDKGEVIGVFVEFISDDELDELKNADKYK